MAKLGDLIVKIGADTRELNKSLGKVRREMKRFGSNFKSLGRDLSRSVTLPLAAIGAAAIKSASDLETLETSFISLTGGTEQARNMMKQLNEFTAKTPFQIDAVAKSARQLIASGTGVGEVNNQLQFLGDIAATSGSSIDEIAAIFAKVNAKGKVELENLNQLAERGIPIFKALSDATGLPAEKLGAGRVTVEQFNAVLKSFAEQGGFAEGAMERLSETTAGKFSTAIDNLKIAGASLVESIMPLLKQAIDKLTEFTKGFTRLTPEVKNIILMVGGIAAAIGPLLVILPTLGGALSAAFSLAAGPIGIIVAGIAAMTIGFFKYFDEIEAPLTNHINHIITLYNEIDLVRVGIGYLEGAFKQLGNVITFQLKNIMNALDTSLGTWVTLFAAGPEAAFEHFKKASSTFVSELAEGGKEIYEGVKIEIEEHVKRDPIELLNFGDLGAKKDEILDLLNFENWFIPLSSGAVTATEDVNNLLDKLTELQIFSSLVEDLDESTKSVSYLAEQFSLLGDQISNTFANAIVEGENFGDAIKQMSKQILKTLLAEAIANAITNASSAKNPANQLSAGLSIPAFIAAAVGSVKKAFGGVPALAAGGLAFGETMSIVGDNRNAAIDPEVIAPLSKLKDYMGGGNTNVYGRISGDDILISNARASRDRNRFA